MIDELQTCEACGYTRYPNDMINFGCQACAVWGDKEINALRAEVAALKQKVGAEKLLGDEARLCVKSFEEKLPGHVDALRAEVAEQRMYAEEYGKEVLTLRAEVAALKADQKQGGIDYCNLRTVADERLVEIIALKGRLKRYTGPLTDEQAASCYPFGYATTHAERVGLAVKWDAAIRAAREGER